MIDKIMINRIIQLSQSIDQTWKKDGYTKDNFSKACTNVLSDFEFDCSLEQFDKEMGEWILAGNLPTQLNVYNAFGQPPVTLFNNGQFVIDIYFWMYVDTSIHSHSFSGAFKLLYGRSVHEIFSVGPKNVFSDDVMSTHINKTSTKLILPGDTQEITSGNEFSHRLIHLDAPTVTLCVRTVDDQTKSQWHHFSNGLSIEKRALSESVIKGIFYYQYLYTLNPESAVSFLDQLIDSWDISTTLNFYEQLSIDGMGIGPEAIGCFFDTVVDKYGRSEWFKLYEGFYQMMSETCVEFEGNTADIRFLEHAINTRYSRAEAYEFLMKIQNSELTQFQKDQLSILS
jgi:hypothetical protein